MQETNLLIQDVGETDRLIQVRMWKTDPLLLDEGDRPTDTGQRRQTHWYRMGRQTH